MPLENVLSQQNSHWLHLARIGDITAAAWPPIHEAFLGERHQRNPQGQRADGMAFGQFIDRVQAVAGLVFSENLTAKFGDQLVVDADGL